LVAVVGRSGSGKSSLVYAGLLPALRRQALDRQRAGVVWDVVSFRPGKWPLRALAACFGAVPEGAGPARIDAYLEDEAEAYRRGDAGKLGRIVADRLKAAPERADRLLIYVDQWEELYAMTPSAEEAPAREQHARDVARFVELLLAATSGVGARATVVLTVRADFYGPLIRHPGLSALLPRQQVNLGPMLREDLRAAVLIPAERIGLRFEPRAVVEQILDEVGTDEGMLPLLQYALKETWLRREGDRLTAKAYAEAGGVRGAIRSAAERAYAELTEDEKAAARRLFLGLVTPGEGQ
jgi:hypothetical protein